MKLCFATNNLHKIEEVKALLHSTFRLTTLEEAGIFQELAETQDTLEGNALQKARFVFQHTGIPCFADDTGLEVNSLHGAPGVISARYAGPRRDSSENIRLLLQNMEGFTNRDARFRTVVALILPQGEWLFEGVVMGKILREARGVGGFGYDPVFLPDVVSKTLAEMSMDEKNRISHRAMAVGKLAHFLSKL